VVGVFPPVGERSGSGGQANQFPGRELRPLEPSALHGALFREQASSSLVVERADSRWFELFGVLKLVPQDFHDQTDECIRNGVCR